MNTSPKQIVSKNILICILLFCFLKTVSAQDNAIAWQETLGGPGNDILHDIYPTADGNYILLGIDSLKGGDVEYRVKGDHDIWIIKMDPSGNIIWQKSYGGGLEEGNPNAKIIQTSDGGYLFVTETWSNNGDVIGHHGASDAWTVKLDANGNIVWSHSFGGSDFDVPRNVLELPGQRYLIMSRSSSQDGDVPYIAGKAGFNAWVFIVDKNGNIIHNYVFGGSKYDDLYTPILCADGSIAMFGQTSSHDGDLAGLNPDNVNAWYLRIDTNGNILSNRIYTVSSNESFLDAVSAGDGGFLVGGEMLKAPISPIDIGTYHGSGDFWSVRLDASGNVLWQGLYGGSSVDNFKCLAPLSDQSGYYLAGYSSSTDGNVEENADQDQDMWIVTINNDGTLRTASILGGSQKDFADAITSSGIAVGGTYSNDGDVTGLQGDGDGWVVQLTTVTSATVPANDQQIKVYPNPFHDFTTVQLPVQSFPSVMTLQVCDVAGRILEEENVHSSKLILHVQEPAGTYWLLLLENNQMIARKELIVQ